MSQTIKYGVIQPPEPKALNTHTAPEWFIFILNKGFGTFPVDLDKNSLDTLKGMSACFDKPNEFDELIQAIRRWGMIRVWSETNVDPVD